MNKKSLALLLLDALLSSLILYLSFLIRFDFSIPPLFVNTYIFWVPWFILFQVIVFHLSNSHARIWRFTSLFDLYSILRAVTIISVLSSIFVMIYSNQTGYPRSVLLLYFILNSIVTVSIRLAVRVYYTHYHEDSILKETIKTKKILLIGAGKTGEKIAREIMTSAFRQYSIAGFVDDDSKKQGALIHGKEVLCKVNNIMTLKIKFDELLITTSSASGDQMRHIVEACKETRKPFKTVPGLDEIIDGHI